MKAEALNLTNPAHTVAYAAPAAPLSAAEVETAMTNALTVALKSAKQRSQGD